MCRKVSPLTQETGIAGIRILPDSLVFLKLELLERTEARKTTMHMDRAIFDLQASVGATSLYILICALMDQGDKNVTLGRASRKWNGTREELHQALEELIQRGVLSAADGRGEDVPLQVNPRENWHSRG
jgi:hypothetical protein